MTIEAVAAASSLASGAPVSQVGAANVGMNVNAASSPGVFDSLVNGLQNLNTQMVANQQAIESLAVGQGEDLHRVIMDLESTKLKFDLALQVRNKVLDAYQELMRMQI